MKKNVVTIIRSTLVAFILLLTSCGIMQKSSNPKMIEGAWKIIKLNGQSITAQDENSLVIQFDLQKKHLGGFGYCNGFGGEFIMDSNGNTQIGEIMSTRVGCEGNITENELFKAFRETKKIMIKGKNAYLYDSEKGEGTPRIVLKK